MLAEAIKNLRKKTFYSQEAFASEIKVTAGTINRWEKGKCMPNITAMKNIKKFCDEKGCSFDEIEECWFNVEKGDSTK